MNVRHVAELEVEVAVEHAAGVVVQTCATNLRATEGKFLSILHLLKFLLSKLNPKTLLSTPPQKKNRKQILTFERAHT
jgi:hypothetical protein